MLNYYDFIKAHPELYKQFSCKELLFLICECPPDFTKSEDWAEHNCFLYVKELLLNIIINPANRELAAYFYKLSTPGTDDLQEIMERNCLYDLQLHEYARLCHRSLSSFKRDFHTTYRTPPGRWLLEKRLETAHRLLEVSDKPVADVALESGFKNNAHFCRAFKNHFKISPLQCRKQVTTMETVYS